MSEKKKFNEVGDTAEKVTWNTAGTRKWKMTYTLLEVNPSWRKQQKQSVSEEASNEEPITQEKKSSAPKAKSKKSATAKGKSKAAAKTKQR